VSNQDDSPENSLLRRVLREDSQSGPSAEVQPEESAPLPPPSPRPPQPKSPVRPQVQDETVPQELLTPSVPATPPPVTVLTPREQMQRAEEALIQLREKMAQIAAEFAQGKLNRAQFDAIYARYSEQRLITERLLARNPDSQAWQSVIRPGHTNFLKLHYESRVVSYTIYDQDSFALIHHTGEIQLEHTQLLAVLQRLKSIMRERGNPGPATKNLSDSRCVLFMPGKISVAVVIFSVEPSAAQIVRVQDIHRDFERANQHALSLHDYTAERLVFPHRALFEEKKY